MLTSYDYDLDNTYDNSYDLAFDLNHADWSFEFDHSGSNDYSYSKQGDLDDWIITTVDSSSWSTDFTFRMDGIGLL